MAQKVRVEMLDDLDGSTATQTIPFTLDGISYEIDLSDENAAALRSEFARFSAAARRTGGRKARTATGRASTTDRGRNQQIRAWANANGHPVSERGRLSSEVIALFEQAQAAEAAEVTEADAPAPRKRAPRKKVAAARK